MDPQNLVSAAKAGLRFDFATLYSKPQLILRFVSLLFSIIVFGCISSGGWVNKKCIYSRDGSACSFGTAVGVIAFLAAICFIISDVMFDRISNVKRRKNIILADVAYSGFWTFLWFVSFCLLTNKWSGTSAEWLKKMKVKSWQENNARGAIVFSLFSVAVWGGITFFAIKRFREGMQGSFDPSANIEQQVGGGPVGGEGMDPGMGGAAPYSAYPGVDGTGPGVGGQVGQGDMSGSGYHDTPFSGGGGGGGYPPTY